MSPLVLLAVMGTACDVGGVSPDAPPAADDTDAPSGSDAGAEDRGAANDAAADAADEPYKGVANSPCEELQRLGATWYYHWGLDGESCGGAEFVPMVWGGSDLTPDAVIAAVQRAVDAGHTTVPEFGCLNESNPDAATVQAFYEGAVEMLEDHPRVVRYAWFPWTENNHLTEDGVLTQLGTSFAAAPAGR